MLWWPVPAETSLPAHLAMIPDSRVSPPDWPICQLNTTQWPLIFVDVVCGTENRPAKLCPNSNQQNHEVRWNDGCFTSPSFEVLCEGDLNNQNNLTIPSMPHSGDPLLYALQRICFSIFCQSGGGAVAAVQSWGFCSLRKNLLFLLLSISPLSEAPGVARPGVLRNVAILHCCFFFF